MKKNIITLLLINIIIFSTGNLSAQIIFKKNSKASAYIYLSPRLLITQFDLINFFKTSIDKTTSPEMLADQLIEIFDIQPRFKSLIADTINKYGYDITLETLELIKQNSRQNDFLMFAFQTLETIPKAIAQLGQKKILTPLKLKNIQTPISGEFEILPNSVGFFSSQEKLESLYFSFFPLRPERDLKFRKNHFLKIQNHVPDAFAFIRFYMINNKIIVTDLQSDMYSSLSSNYKRRLKNWPEMMLAAIEEFAQENNITQIIMPDSELQLKLFKVPEQITLRVYDQAAKNQNFRTRKKFEPKVKFENIIFDTCWIKDIYSLPAQKVPFENDYGQAKWVIKNKNDILIIRVKHDPSKPILTLLYLKKDLTETAIGRFQAKTYQKIAQMEEGQSGPELEIPKQFSVFHYRYLGKILMIAGMINAKEKGCEQLRIIDPALDDFFFSLGFIQDPDIEYAFIRSLEDNLTILLDKFIAKANINNIPMQMLTAGNSQNSLNNRIKILRDYQPLQKSANKTDCTQSIRQAI
ncbi:MAG: hypothetical protein ABIG64_09650 [Candidatus Omnitrophota bacterium]